MVSTAEQWQSIHAALRLLRGEQTLVAFHPVLDVLLRWAHAVPPPYPLPYFQTFLALVQRARQATPVLLPAQVFQQECWEGLLRQLSARERIAPDELQAFLANLCDQLRPAMFQAAEFPEGFVQRPTEYGALLERLLGEGDGQMVAITTALRGAGGYGKTTLARAICHDPRIWQAFPDGILWVTLGETPGDLLVPMQRLIQALTPMGGVQRDSELGEGEQAGLAPEMLASLRATLLRCGPASHRELEDLFVDARLAPWRYEIPPGDTTKARVQALVNWLHDRENSAGENALLLFLGVLLESIQEGQGCREEVQRQASALRQALNSQGGRAAPAAPIFTDLNEARAALEKVLGNKRLLLVVDDVWVPGHLTPFLVGGIYCTRLVTTRDSSTLPPKTERPLTVDAMRQDEAVALLGAGLSETGQAEALRVLARRLGHWPLLLRLANSQLLEWQRDLDVTVEMALQEVDEALTSMGLSTLDDPDNPDERQRAAAATLRVSLARLSRVAHYGRLTVDELRCYQQLTLFPEDTEVPLSVLAWLWGLDMVVTRRVCARFRQLSLLLDYKGMKTLRLHDVVRTFLIEQQVEDLPALHRGFLSTCRPASGLWWELPRVESYLWQHLAYHLVQAGQEAELRRLLLDYEWLRAKLAATDARALLGDYRHLGEDADLQQAERALRHAAHILVHDPTQLPAQLLGRLLDTNRPDVQALLEQARHRQTQLWLRPLRASFREEDSLVFTLVGHTEFVNGVAVSGDGRYVVSASYDKTLKVWELASGQEVRTLIGHTESVSGVAVSGDGRYVVSASYDKTLKVWELASGQEVRTLIGHTESVSGVAVSGDGRYVVSASDDRTLKVWELASGRELRTLVGHIGGVSSVAVSIDGRYVISASWDNTLRMWELGSGQKVRTLVGHTGGVTGLAVSGDGCYVISASHDETLKVWELESGRELRTLAGHTHWLTKVAVGGDGRYVISASYDKTLKVWELESGREIRTLAGHTDLVSGIAASTDGRYVISASYDKTLKVWELEGGREIRTLAGPDFVSGVAVSPDGRYVISTSSDNMLKVWALESGQEVRTLIGHTNFVSGVTVSMDGRYVISASWDNTLKVWALESGQEVRTLIGHTDGVSGVTVSMDGRYVISASNRILKVWELASGQEVRTLVGHTGLVNGLVVGADGRYVISASSDNTLKVWVLENGQEVHTLVGHTGLVRGVAVSPDGCYVISASHDNTLKVWALEGGQEVHTLVGHTDGVSGVAASPDGRYVISTSWDGILKVWGTRSWQCLITCHTGDALSTCTIAPDGVTVIAAGSLGRLHVLRLEGVGGE